MSANATETATGNEFLTIEWADATADAVDQPCPNCGAPGGKPPVLTVSWMETRREKPVRRRLFSCPACTGRFFGAVQIPPYHDGLVIGWPELHAQQGAGLWSIDSPIARISKPPGARYLEIGCGYGFALDFARHARGWQALGIDPAPLAELGCRLLGVELRAGYFPEADPYLDQPDTRWDVMVATEVIEHLEHPADLLRDMRARLADDGVLLLTTPDGEAIAKATGEAALAQLLAPELHMVFQTSASLTKLLHEAGFTHAELARDATSLVAFASPAPLDLNDDMPSQRRMFRDYLAKRAREADQASDLGLGFAGRAMAEAVNDGDFATAALMRNRVWDGIKARFGLDLDQISQLPPGVHDLDLQRLRFALPYNLPAVLFADAMRRLGQGATRREVRRELSLAAEASALLIKALAALSLNDGMTEDIAWQAKAELALADAEAGDPASLASLSSLPPAGPARRQRIVWRALVALGNAGAMDVARRLADQEALDDVAREADDALPADLRQDGLMALGRLALDDGGDPMRAIRVAKLLGDAPFAADLLLIGFTRLVNASRYDEADAVRAPAWRHAAARRDAVSRDARLALAVLDLVTGDPANVAETIQGLDLETARREALLLGAFTKLVNFSRYQEAREFAAAHDIVGIAMARRDDAARDARLALAVLDLAAGDPALVPLRLDGLDIDSARHHELILSAFTRLVNLSRFDEAKELASAQRIAEIAMHDDTEAARDARLALAVLDLTSGDPADVPGRLAGLEIEQERRRSLILGAYTRLVNAARFDDAIALREAEPIRRWISSADAASADAAYASIMLELAAGDPALVPSLLESLPELAVAEHDDLLLQAFLRLAQNERQDAARDLALAADIAGFALRAAADLRDAALTALIQLELRPPGMPAQISESLDHWQASGLDPAAVKSLASLAFVSLVNAQAFGAAELLRPRIEPAFSNFAKASTQEARDAGFALGVLHLQSLDPEHPAQPFRAEAAFSAVRRGFADALAEGDIAPALFWEALRGELLALHKADRGNEASALGRAMLAQYRGAPDDLAHDFGSRS